MRSLVTLCGIFVLADRNFLVLFVSRTIDHLVQHQEGLDSIFGAEGICAALVHILSSQGPGTATYLTSILSRISDTDRGQLSLTLISDLFGILSVHLWSSRDSTVSHSLHILSNVPNCFLGSNVLLTGDTITRLTESLSGESETTLIDTLKVFGSIAELESGRQAIVDHAEIISVFMKMTTSNDGRVRYLTRVLAQLGKRRIRRLEESE